VRAIRQCSDIAQQKPLLLILLCLQLLGKIPAAYQPARPPSRVQGDAAHAAAVYAPRTAPLSTSSSTPSRTVSPSPQRARPPSPHHIRSGSPVLAHYSPPHLIPSPFQHHVYNLAHPTSPSGIPQQARPPSPLPQHARPSSSLPLPQHARPSSPRPQYTMPSSPLLQHVSPLPQHARPSSPLPMRAELSLPLSSSAYGAFPARPASPQHVRPASPHQPGPCIIAFAVNAANHARPHRPQLSSSRPNLAGNGVHSRWESPTAAQYRSATPPLQAHADLSEWRVTRAEGL